MLSLNELAMSIQGLEDSDNNNSIAQNHKKHHYLKNNTNASQSINQSQSSNSRQLFRKCKQIIQQQMTQIHTLSTQNQSLNEEITHLKSQQSKNTLEISNLQQQLTELTLINQTLHKEMHKMTQKIQQLTQHATERQNILKLSQNKNQALESVVQKIKKQNQTFKEKFHLMESTIDLIKIQNNRLEEVVREKQDDLKRQVQKLRKFKEALERRNMINEEEVVHKMNMDACYERQNSIRNFNPKNHFNTIVLNRYPSVQNYHHTLSMQNKNLSDCKTVDRTTQKITMNKSMHHISPFSIVDEKPSISRIRKNFSKPKPHDTTTTHFNTLTPIPQRSHKQQNPEIHSQLSSIKKQLMKQYNMIEVKKEIMSQGMIGKTLKEIEKKLERMTKLSKVEMTESEVE